MNLAMIDVRACLASIYPPPLETNQAGAYGIDFTTHFRRSKDDHLSGKWISASNSC